MAGTRTPCSPGTAPGCAAIVLLAVLAGTACGGAAPMLHPAHALPVGTVSAGAGVSSQFASNRIDNIIERGRSAAAQALQDPSNAELYATGVLARALVGPGASP